MINLVSFDTFKLSSPKKLIHLSDGGVSENAIDTLLLSSVREAEKEIQKWYKRWENSSRKLIVIVHVSIEREVLLLIDTKFGDAYNLDQSIYSNLILDNINAHISKIARFWNISEKEIWIMANTVEDFWVDPDKLITWDEGLAEHPTVGDAWVLMRDNKIGHLPLVNKGKLSGLITWTSIVDLIPMDKEIIGTRAHNLEYIKILKKPLDEDRIIRLDRLITLQEKCSVINLLKAFITLTDSQRYPSLLPVINKDNELISVVSWVNLFDKFELLKLPDPMPVASEIRQLITRDNIVNGSHSILLAVQKVNNNSMPYILVLNETNEPISILSDRDIANWKLENHEFEDDDIRNKLITEQASNVSPMHNLDKITVHSELPLWTENGDSIISKFLESVVNEKNYFDRIGCLLVIDSKNKNYGFVTPEICLKALFEGNK